MRDYPLLARRTAATLVTGLAAFALAGCSASRTGHAGVAMDPAGRLLVVVALCDNQRIGSLTLTDETTGSAITVHPTQTPAPGGTLILTGPIANPRPEGLFDLLDVGHEYTLSATTKGTGADADDEQTGTLAPIRFKLDDVVKDPTLREGSVLAVNEDEDGTALSAKDAFVAQAREECD